MLALLASATVGCFQLTTNCDKERCQGVLEPAVEQEDATGQDAAGGAGGRSSGGCCEGLSACDGQCVDTETDPAHCGGCGMGCSEDSACVDGACQSEEKIDELTAIAFPHRTGDATPDLAVDGDINTLTFTTPGWSFTEPAFLGAQFPHNAVRRLRLHKSNHSGCACDQCDLGVKDLVIQYTTHKDPASVVSEPLNSPNWVNVGGLRNGDGLGNELLTTVAYGDTAGGVSSDGFIDNESHSSTPYLCGQEAQGWASLSFDAVQATAIRIGFWQDHIAGPNMNHYTVNELEVYGF